MDKLACMHAFVTVVEANGFSSAARKSGTSKALLSKYVAQLEVQLDTRLLQRTTRHVSPTEVGRAYYERCLPLLEELDELESVVHDIHTTPTGELKISAPTSFAELHLMDIVAEFSRRYPEIRINMTLTDRQVDIVSDGIDLALRIGNLTDSSLVARRLATLHTVAYASPEYLTHHGEPKQPNDLLQHRCIIDTNIKEANHWRFTKNTNQDSVSVSASHYINSAIAVRELVLANMGIAISPFFVVSEDIQSGRLKLVLQDYEIHSFGLYAVYSHRRHLSAKVQLFIELLSERLSTTSDWQ